MSDVARYLAAGTRDNTRRSYRAAIEHFEVNWGGLLPATAESIARYLADHAGSHSLATLRQRLAALSQWHLTQGFADPVRTPLVRQVFKGIRALHPAQPRQATPLGIETLQRVHQALEAEAADPSRRLRARRDQALLLLGFWRGLRSDELARLQVEHVHAQAGLGIELYLPRSKGDRQNLGSQLRTPALTSLCPVQAYLAWITEAGLARGPVFRSIDRWGRLGNTGLHSNSLIPLMRNILERGGVQGKAYSSHSLRRGFATWATANGWDLKSLMAYVGWKDVKSALRYIDPATSFGGLALEGPPAIADQ